MHKNYNRLLMALRKFPIRAHLYIELYRANIYITSLEDMNDYYTYMSGSDEPISLNRVAARTVWRNDKKTGSIMIFVGFNLPHLKETEAKTAGIIAHEAFHVTEFILQRVGMIHGDGSSEAFAYLLEMIVAQLTNWKNSKQVQKILIQTKKLL